MISLVSTSIVLGFFVYMGFSHSIENGTKKNTVVLNDLVYETKQYDI